jgi:hypothetical protein
MAGFGIELKGLERLNASLSAAPLRSTLRLAFLQGIGELQKEIKTSVKNHYSILQNIDSITYRELGRNQKRNIVSISLVYKYKKVPLSAYPVLQQRITVNKQTLRVTRTKPGKFSRSIISDEVYFTFVKVKKDWKLVVGKHGPDKKGRAGFMGWLHTGGLGSNRFKSAGIFERAQQATWREGQRLPVFELYGPAFTEIVSSPEVQRDIENSQAIRKLLDYIQKHKHL